jgi:transcriptional regulator with XRE-family HTH domain
MQIGKLIRDAREAQKMTLTELSQKSGVQIATLSRMENLKMTGTLESHMQIAKALGVDVTSLYKGLTAPHEQPLAKSDSPSTETVSYNNKAAYEILAANILRKKMMPVVLRIDPGGQTNEEENKAGTEKFVFVLEGKITAHVAGAEHPLSPGRTMYFDASLKHHFENAGAKTAKMIVVVTPVAL